jgi:hypothetical protein
MFTVRLGTRRFLSPRGRNAASSVHPGYATPARRILCLLAVTGALASTLPRTSSAQALGTMQVTARVVPASVAWAGVAEVGHAVRSATADPAGRVSVRRGRLIQGRTEIRSSGGRRLLIVTIQHPHN